jgi:hypothetical protein
VTHSGTGRLRIEKLTADHELDVFECGEESLDRFLKRHALLVQGANSVQTCSCD